MKLSYNNRRLIYKLISIGVLTTVLGYLSYRFNFIEYVGKYAFTAFGIITYFGLFSIIGVDDVKNFYNKWIVRKYLDKTCILKYKLYSSDFDYSWVTKEVKCVDFTFGIKNELLLTLSVRNLGPRFGQVIYDENENIKQDNRNDEMIETEYYLFGMVNPLTNGFYFTNIAGDLVHKDKPRSFEGMTEIRMILGYGSREHINYNVVSLKVKR